VYFINTIIIIVAADNGIKGNRNRTIADNIQYKGPAISLVPKITTNGNAMGRDTIYSLTTRVANLEPSRMDGLMGKGSNCTISLEK
jgi:hypothetical protein